jgi:hypothetical protein
MVVSSKNDKNEVIPKNSIFSRLVSSWLCMLTCLEYVFLVFVCDCMLASLNINCYKWDLAVTVTTEISL